MNLWLYHTPLTIFAAHSKLPRPNVYKKINKYKDLFLITIVAKSKEVDDIKTKRGAMNNLQSFKKITHRLSYGNGPLKLS